MWQILPGVGLILIIVLITRWRSANGVSPRRDTGVDAGAADIGSDDGSGGDGGGDGGGD